MILKAAWVVPVTSRPIRAGMVRIAADRIVAVGSAEQGAGEGGRPARPGRAAARGRGPLRRAGPFIDLGDAVLTPGLVNPHTHLELTAYAGQLAPGPLWSWLPKLVLLRRAAWQTEREQRGVQDGAWQSLRAGVTCVGDISRLNLHWPVLKDIPIRKVCFVELLTLADDPPRNPDELRVAVEQVEEDGLLTAGISPHAPYTVPAEQIRAAIELADRIGRPWCSHWAETREELAFLLGDAQALPGYMRELLAQCGLRSPGLSAIELLEQCSRGLRPGVLAHFNYAQAGDAERLAAAGHVVVYCPRAHQFFGHAPHPYRSLINAGVTVTIGTDSAASNENLALLDELRFLRQQTPDPPSAETLFQMVTLRAARALGLHGQIGSLEPGKQADLVAFPCPPNADDPLETLVERAPQPIGVWVAGHRAI